MSWESTVPYYQIINTEFHRHLGGYHSAPILLHSVDFAVIEEMQRTDNWEAAARVLAEAAWGLERLGAQLLLLATNTMHLVFAQLESATSVPWIHIADAVGSSLQKAQVKKPILLGTRFTMERDFYRARLLKNYGIDVFLPGSEERREIDRIIFGELVHGVIKDTSRDYFKRVIERLTGAGADSAILGCTEIGLLIRAEDSDVPVFDSAELHARAAVERLFS